MSKNGLDQKDKKAAELKKLINRLDWDWNDTATLHVAIPKSLAIYLDILRFQNIPKGKYLTIMFGKMNRDMDFDKLEGVMRRKDIDQLKKIIEIANSSSH